jgi:hypothetical protein
MLLARIHDVISFDDQKFLYPPLPRIAGRENAQKCGMRGYECVRWGIWDAECGVRDVGCGMWGAECGEIKLKEAESQQGARHKKKGGSLASNNVSVWGEEHTTSTSPLAYTTPCELCLQLIPRPKSCAVFSISTDA